MLNASERRVNKSSWTWWYVSKTSWRYLCKKYSRRLQNVLKTSWRYLEDVFQDVLKISWRRFSRRLEDVLKTSWRRMAKMNILVLTKTSWKCLEDVFWRRKAKANIFVLIKTSWRRLHQDECLLGSNEILKEYFQCIYFGRINNC